MDTDELAGPYVRRWFVEASTLAKMSGCSLEQMHEFIKAGICPGAIYALTPHGWWWSTLGFSLGRHGPLPAGSLAYYTPGAAWWLRRAVQLERTGVDPVDIALMVRADFSRQFFAGLAIEPLARHSFPECFDGDRIESNRATERADKEWQAWLRGGYGVCLHHSTGRSCVEKESLAKVIRDSLEPGGDVPPEVDLIDLVERLSALILPFSPRERPVGTPGKTIDRYLAWASLGSDEPYRGLA